MLGIILKIGSASPLNAVCHPSVIHSPIMLGINMYINFSRKSKSVVEAKKREKYKVLTTIPYPAHKSEVEITCHILTELKNMGFDARAEVTAHDKRSRFDIVVYSNKKPIRILEIKKNSQEDITSQKGKYSKYKIEVDFIRGWGAAKAYLRKAKNILSNIKPPEIYEKKYVKNEGDECKKCGNPVELKYPVSCNRKKSYYYKSYLKCPACNTIYFLEEEKVYYKRSERGYNATITNKNRSTKD